MRERIDGFRSASCGQVQSLCGNGYERKKVDKSIEVRGEMWEKRVGFSGNDTSGKIVFFSMNRNKSMMMTMKRYVAVLLMAALVCVSNVWAEELEVVDRIVAVVNDEIITYSMVNEAFAPYEKKLRENAYPLDKEIEMRFKIRSNLIQQLIDQEITNQEVKKAQITVSSNEIDTYVERIKQMNSFTDEDLRKMLETEGVTLEQYKKEIKNILLRNKLIQYEVKSRIVVTQKDIDDYYEKHKDEFKDKKKEEVSDMIADKVYQVQADEKFGKWVARLREQAQITINE